MVNDFLPPKKDTGTHTQPKTPLRRVSDDLDKPIALSDKPPAKKAHWPSRLIAKVKRHWSSWSRNTRFAVISGSLLLFGTASLGFYYSMLPQSEPEISIKTKPKIIVPKTVASPLTGVQVEPALAARPVTAIMIENSQDARPQSGLEQAGVVFEAIAEGGITRFLALFQESSPQYIGPVRSLRPYYIDWAAAFDASIAHVGGSPDALAQIRSGGKDLDQFFNAGSYWRQPTRAAPHNVYTSFAKLDELNKSKGYTSSKYTSWLRKDDARLATPTARTIDLSISSYNFNVHYDYDVGFNAYARSEGGAPHLIITSPNEGVSQQLRPKVVVALVMGYGIASDGQHSEYIVNGSGALYAFQDGGVTEGTWSKADRNSQFIFKDTAGNPLKLNTGPAWVTVLSDASKVKYAP